jgi:uncharacterized membrane protein
LLSCLLTWAALRVAPRLAALLVLLYFLPMSLFLRSSVSADVLTISLSWLLIALVARELEEDSADRASLIFKPLVAGLLILTKPLFIVVAVLVVLPPLLKRQWKRVVGNAAVIVVAAGMAAAVTASVLTPMRPDAPTDPQAQISRTLQQPVDVGLIIAKDLATSSPRYARELIGRLGWLDTAIPMAVTLCLIIALPGLALTSPSSGGMTPLVRSMMIMLLLTGAAGILWSNFVLWTPLEAPGVEGPQGRHFLPLIPLGLLPLTGVFPQSRRFTVILALAGSILGAVSTVLVVLYRYWV